MLNIDGEATKDVRCHGLFTEDFDTGFQCWDDVHVMRVIDRCHHKHIKFFLLEHLMEVLLRQDVR